jgi:hypothetical protein
MIQEDSHVDDISLQNGIDIHMRRSTFPCMRMYKTTRFFLFIYFNLWYGFCWGNSAKYDRYRSVPLGSPWFRNFGKRFLPGDKAKADDLATKDDCVWMDMVLGLEQQWMGIMNGYIVGYSWNIANQQLMGCIVYGFIYIYTYTYT